MGRRAARAAGLRENRAETGSGAVLELLMAVGVGLAMLLPLANPLTTVALLMGLSRGMSEAEPGRARSR